MAKNKDVQEIHIVASDYYGESCLGDSLNRNESHERRPRGEVEIYEVTKDGNKKLVRKSNLVVYLGREILAQILTRKNNTNVYSAKDHFLCWFGLGDGGVLPADPFTPVPPANENDDLESRVMINATDSSAADYHIVSPGYPKEGYYKVPFDSLTFERDIYNDGRWLVFRIQVTIGVDDANGEALSEAGLFTAESSTGGWSGDFHLFSRVTFPSLIKDENRRFIITWYLYV
jgi:hypothetical protein